VDLSVLGANVVLRLNRPVRLHGMLGRTRDAKAIALSIDDRDGFVRALAQPARNSATAIAGSPARTVQSGM